MGRDLEVEEEEWEGGEASWLMEGAGGKRDFPHTIYRRREGRAGEDESRTSVRFLFFLQVREKCFLPFIFICFLVKYGLDTVL